MELDVPHTDTVELIYRNQVIEQLLRAGLQVAMPLQPPGPDDIGFDLIVYQDAAAESSHRFEMPMPPILVKFSASTGPFFCLDQQYQSFSNLIHIFAWYLDDHSKTEYYVTSFPEALAIATGAGWTNRNDFRITRSYGSTEPGKKVLARLEPYRITNNNWKARIQGALAALVATPPMTVREAVMGPGPE